MPCFDNRAIHRHGPHHAQQLGIATIYQEFNLAPDMTVAENVFLGREPLSVPVLGLVDYARQKAREAGVGDKVKFVRGDIFKTDFSSASVVTTFLLPSMNLQLRPTFLRMKPGTRIVSNTHPIADWPADAQAGNGSAGRSCSRTPAPRRSPATPWANWSAARSPNCSIRRTARA